MKKLILVVLLAFTAAAHAAQGGGNDVLMGADWWLYLSRLWNNWDGFTL